MATYKVQAPDGHTITLQGPDGATEAEILAQAQKAYQPKAGLEKSPLGAFLANARGAASGASFNFSDELAAAAKTVLPVPNAHSGFTEGFGPAYEANLKHVRERDAAYEAAHPVASGAGNLEGAVGGLKGIGALKALFAPRAVATTATAATKFAPALAKTAAAGAGYGAVSGFGAGDTVGSRVRSAKIGATTGAVMGAALHGTVAGAFPLVRRYATALMGKNVTQDGLRAIRTALARDGYDVNSPDGVKALEAELGRYANKPVSLADVGINTRSRAVVGLKSPSAAQGPGLDVVNARLAGQPARLRKDITDTVAPRTDVNAIDDSLVEQRAKEALPLKDAALYDANPTAGAPTTSGLPKVVAGRQLTKNLPVTGAEGAKVPVVPDDPVLQQLARLPLAQDALGNARSIVKAEKDRLNTVGADTTHLPDFPETGAPLDMRALDYLKRSLDDEVSSAYRSPESGTRAMAPQLQSLRDEIRDRMRQAVPEYGQYLDRFSGTSELRDALKEGRDFTKLDPEVVAAEQAKRSDAGQEFYRVGAARDLVDTVNNTSDANYPSARIMNSPEARASVAATGADADTLGTRVEQENTLNLLPRATRSIGAGVLGANAAGADAGLNTSVPYNFLSPRNLLAVAAQKGLGVADLARNAKVNEAVLPRLLETNPQAIQATINDLVSNGQYEKARTLASQAKLSYTAKLLGNIAGSPVSIQEGN